MAGTKDHKYISTKVLTLQESIFCQTTSRLDEYGNGIWPVKIFSQGNSLSSSVSIKSHSFLPKTY